MKAAIRERTPQEPHLPRYVVYSPETGNLWTVFGLVQGGDSKEEVLFWAERLVSKNGLEFERPEGWEGVEPKLPRQSDAERRKDALDCDSLGPMGG